MKKLILGFLLTIMLTVGVGVIRADSTVQAFLVVCETQAVMNLNGTMDAGFDVYYQIFSGAGATGTALTNLRRVSVDGAFAFSENLPYTGGTVATGAIGSAKVFVANERNSTSSVGESFTVDDLQDGCNNAQNTLGTSTDAGTTTTTTTTTTGGSNILSPFGGVINPSTNATPEPLVVIGARSQSTAGRSATPGVLFAECDQNLPGAAPGVLYNSDNIVIFWSWFAKTEQQVQDHIAQAQYDVALNRAPLVDVQVSTIQQRTNNFWVFYTATIGHLAPGGYGVEFRLSWRQAISDGYDDYGPGTPTESVYSTCTFNITPNPFGLNITDTSLMYSVR